MYIIIDMKFPMQTFVLIVIGTKTGDVSNLRFVCKEEVMAA